MSYKTIAVYLAQPGSVSSIMDVALPLAESFGAHLIGLHISSRVPVMGTIGAQVPAPSTGGGRKRSFRFTLRSGAWDKMPSLHVERRALGAERRMDAARRVAQPHTLGIAAVLVFEDTVEDENLFTAQTGVTGELGAGRPLS